MSPRVVSLMIVAVVALAGCGGSSSGPVDQHALSTCVDTGATRAQCECAIRKAESEGYTAKRFADEETNGTAITDPKFIRIAASCIAG